MFYSAAPSLTGTLVQIPEGRAGAVQTVRAMRAAVERAKLDLRIRQAALSLLALTPPKDTLAEIDALLTFVRSRIRYTGDIVGIETVADAATTLQSEAGDCDDMSILLAALLECVGIPTRFVIAGYNGPEFEHVYVAAEIAGELLPLDPTEPHGAGWQAPNPTVYWVER